MRINFIPGKPGFEVVYESPDDSRSMVAVCQACGRVYRYGPDDTFTIFGRKSWGKRKDDFFAVEIVTCRGCDRGTVTDDDGECIGAMLGLLPVG